MLLQESEAFLILSTILSVTESVSLRKIIYYMAASHQSSQKLVAAVEI